MVNRVNTDVTTLELVTHLYQDATIRMPQKKQKNKQNHCWGSKC